MAKVIPIQYVSVQDCDQAKINTNEALLYALANADNDRYGHEGGYAIIHGNHLICQGFISRTPARVRDGSLLEGLNDYPTQLPCLGQLRTHVGSKSLVMQDYERLPRLITAPEYFGNLQREMSQVATQTFNVLYYFPFI